MENEEWKITASPQAMILRHFQRKYRRFPFSIIHYQFVCSGGLALESATGIPVTHSTAKVAPGCGQLTIEN